MKRSILLQTGRPAVFAPFVAELERQGGTVTTVPDAAVCIDCVQRQAPHLVVVDAPTQEQALAAQLARALATRTGRPVQWQALGKNGVTAAATHALLVRRLQPDPHDAVVVVLGVNDTLALRSPGRWTSDLRRLIAAVREKTGPAPVFLTAVPPMGEFPALPAPLRTVLGVRARVLDRAAARLTHQLPDVHHVPLPGRLEGDFFCHDGLHPSPAGYRAWAEHLAAAMAQ